MKKLTTALLTATIAVGALTGCQTTPQASSTATQTQAPAQYVTINSKLLQSYNWQLVDAKRTDGSKISSLFYNPAKPLVLNFMTDGNANRVAFMNTCNNLSAAYDIRNGGVELSNSISTKMLCPEPQEQFDRATMAVVQGKYIVSKRGNQPEMLTIQGPSHVAHFKAIAK